MNNLKKKYMMSSKKALRTSGAAGAGQTPQKERQGWKQARAAKHVWGDKQHIKEDGDRNKEFSTFSAHGVSAFVGCIRAVSVVGCRPPCR